MVRRAGLQMPPGNYAYNPSAWSWQTFLEYARKLTTGDPASGPGAGVFGWNTQFGWRPYSVWGYANGGEFFNKEMTECTITDAKPVEALQNLSDLIHRHKVAPTRQMTMAENFENMFTSGRVAMNESLPGAINRYRAVSGFNFDVAPIPGSTKACTGGGSGYAMYAGTKDPDAAWLFVQHLVGPVVQRSNAEAGSGVPARRSVMDQVFARQAPPPKNVRVFEANAKTARIIPPILRWTEMIAEVNKLLPQLWNGDKTARDVCGEIKRLTDPILKS